MAEPAAAPVPGRGGLPTLRRAAAGCTACHLHERATQTVFGEGTSRATMMLVGEQPGDREDLEGAPFIGPSGRLLDEALAGAGIERARVYLTNVVKHFKWERRGRRRIHRTPSREEIGACRPWLDAELAAVRPAVVVCLGATAAKAIIGPSFRVTRDRGVPVETELDAVVTATVHPSSILRAPDDRARRAQMAAFVRDLHTAAGLVP